MAVEEGRVEVALDAVFGRYHVGRGSCWRDSARYMGRSWEGIIRWTGLVSSPLSSPTFPLLVRRALELTALSFFFEDSHVPA